MGRRVTILAAVGPDRSMTGGADRRPPPSSIAARAAQPVYAADAVTIGWFRVIAPVLPWKSASPNAKTPPSRAVSQ